MKKHSSPVSRRRFIRTVTITAIGAPMILSCLRSRKSPNGKLQHACIGVGGMGWQDLNKFKEDPNVQIIALCDVDADNLRRASAVLPGARTYTDWRELLEKEDRNLDSVNVTVPDHNHFIIAYTAIKKGVNVYCQKPMCHDIAEVRKLTETSKKAGVVTQLGTQLSSRPCNRMGVQLLKDGAIGKIRHIWLCSNRPGAIENYRLPGPRPKSEMPPPATLDWELWTGTAPLRSWAPEIYHPEKWRAWQDFGTGWSGDIGCHIFDAVWKGLGLAHPLSVIAEVQKSWKESPDRRKDTWPQGDHITWMFAGNEKSESDVFPVEWFDGEFYPPEEVRSMVKGMAYPAESAMIIGSEGALLIPHGGDKPLLFPEEKFRDYRLPEFEAGNHYHSFVVACLGGPATESHFGQTGPMTEAILLGTVAIRVPDTLIKWYASTLNTDNAEANQYIRRSYRKGWKVAGF